MDAEIITRQSCHGSTLGKSANEAFRILGYIEPVVYPRLEERLPRKKVRKQFFIFLSARSIYSFFIEIAD